jgi:hypothetical protein
VKLLDIPHWDLICRAAERVGAAITRQAISVSIAEQIMWLWEEGEVVEQYLIGTGLRPPSNELNSGGTPLGLHVIAEKIGANEPYGMLFQDRKPIGYCFQECSDSVNQVSKITSRILWLAGLELENGTSYSRYIYIHGTNREHLLGKEPFTHGCINMGNAEVINLFDRIEKGSNVYIFPSP